MTKSIIPSILSINITSRKFNFLAFILLICLTTPGFAVDVTLQGDANTEPNRAGYRIYYDTDSGPPYGGMEAAEGDSPIGVKIADVEIGNTARYTVTGLNDGEDYYFAVTAYNTSGNESGYSNEVSTGSGNGNESPNSGGGSGCFILSLYPP